MSRTEYSVKTEYGALTSPIDQEDARASLGLWDDRSMDDQLDRLVLSAAAYVRNWLGRAINGESVTCRFRGWADALLMEGVLWGESTTIAGKYYDASNTEQDIEGLVLDPTMGGRVIVPADAQANALSSDFHAPITLTASATGLGDDIENVKNVVRALVVDLWSNPDHNPTPRRYVGMLGTLKVGRAMIGG